MAALFNKNDTDRLRAEIKEVAPDFEPGDEFIEATIKGFMLINGCTSKEAVDGLVAIRHKDD